MLGEDYELFILLALIIMSSEGLDDAEGHVLERYFFFVMKNELLDEFIAASGFPTTSSAYPAKNSMR